MTPVQYSSNRHHTTTLFLTLFLDLWLTYGSTLLRNGHSWTGNRGTHVCADLRNGRAKGPQQLGRLRVSGSAAEIRALLA